MTTFTFPSYPTQISVTPSKEDWGLVTSNIAHRSPLNGSVQTQTRPGSVWGFRFEYNDIDDDDRAVLRALLAKLDGVQHRFVVGPQGQPKRGSWATTGTIRVRTANQTGNDLRLDGFTANQTNVIRDGDWFSVGGRLYMAVEDRDSDGSGRVDDLLIAHQIYTAPDDNAEVFHEYPVRGTFMLRNPNPVWSGKPADQSTFVIEGIEDIQA